MFDEEQSDYYKIIEKELLSCFHSKEVQLPVHVESEFHKYLSCGLLSKGFLRVVCHHCKNEKLVPFSCKSRTICPRCAGRRMNDGASHLLDHVIPDVPIRQWVISFPFLLRYLLAYRPKLQNTVMSIWIRLISSFYKKKAKSWRVQGSDCGSVTVIQRFGGSLNLNVHFHSLFADGVFHNNNFMRIPVSHEEVESLNKKLKVRVLRALKRQGFDLSYMEESDVETNEFESDFPDMANFLSESVTDGKINGSRAEKVGQLFNPPFQPFVGKRCSYVDGFSMHANVYISKYNKKGLEHLCRYILRPAISKERITRLGNDYVLLKLKTPYSDGTTHLKFTTEQFMRRLVALIPPKMANLTRYHGVFGARKKERSKFVKRNKTKKKTREGTLRKEYRMEWAKLLRRVFKIDVLKCNGCGEQMQILCEVVKQEAIIKILNHLKFEPYYPDLEPARGPPVQGDFFNESGDDFNQEYVEQCDF
ncbi:MAG: transposase [Bacteriovoracaceae bacterium]|nr:transposase [Bacteriovoracaceae bacterium]